MAKDETGTDPLEKAERKVTKARMALSVAQEEHAQARVRGKQEVEQARLRAAKWLTKTGKRMERRAAAVAKAEQRLADAQDSTVAVAAEPVTATEQELRPREQHALDALRNANNGQGATASEWQATSGMSEATFLRARRELTDRGLVVRDGDARRGALYRVAELMPG